MLTATLLTGCGSLGGPDAGQGRNAFTALQRATTVAGAAVRDSVVHVKLQRKSAGEADGYASAFSSASASVPSMNGLVLTAEGHILLPETINPKADLRILVWVGDEEHVARVLKSDESLGMSIVKIDGTAPLAPAKIDGAASLAPGEWAVIATASDETGDFQKFTSLSQNRGEIGGRYALYQLTTLPRDARGAPVVNLEGRLVGLCGRVDVLAFADLADDLRSFLAEATGVKSSDDEDESRGWLGVLLEPINKDLARARNLPVASLWVLHADADGPSAAAGLRPGDLIVGLNGQPLRFSGPRTQEFFMKSCRPRAGRPFAFDVVRQGRTIKIEGTMTRRPKPEFVRAEDIGFTVTAITDMDVFARALATREGVMVTEILGGSPAATSSRFGQTLLIRQDVIVELGGRPTRTLAEFNAAVDAVRKAKAPTILVRYWRGPISGFAGLNLRIGERDSGDKS